VREWIGLLVFFISSPISSMMLIVFMSGCLVAKLDVLMMGSCMVALLQLSPATVVCWSELIHLLCLTIRCSCISAGISIVGWQGIMMLLGGRNSMLAVPSCRCMLQSSLTSSMLCLSV
jgi:hypothetical protein